MKKLLCILLMLCFAFPVLAEENPFAPYTLAAPKGCELHETEGTHTFVSGNTRVVAMVIARLPDEKPQEAVLRLMGQFEPNAVIGEAIPLVEGYVGLTATAKDRFGAGIHQVNRMILSGEGALLILSGYDMDGDADALDTLMDALLSSLQVNDTALWLDPDA